MGLPRPKFIPGQRVMVNQSGLPVLVGQTGIVHCDPEWDLQRSGAKRFIGWWYHIVFDSKVFEHPNASWWCTEHVLEHYQGEEHQPSWDTIEKMTGWKRPTKENT